MSKGYLKCEVGVDSNFKNEITSHCTGNYVFDVFGHTVCTKLALGISTICNVSHVLTFIVRHLNPVFVLTVRSFLRDGPLNAQCACRGLER